MTGATLLKDLDIDRVDAVDRPAHKSQFLILKSEDAADLQAGVQKLADASGALFDAVVKGDMKAIRAAAAPLGALLEKDADSLSTIHPTSPDQGMAGGGADGKTAPEVQAEEVAGDVKTGDDVVDTALTRSANDPGSASGDAAQGMAGGAADGKTAPEVQADEVAEDVKTGDEVVNVSMAKFCGACSAPIAKSKYVGKARIAKAACPMCGAPTDTAGKYAEGDATAAAPGPAKPVAAAKGEVPPQFAAHQFKPKGDKAAEDVADGGADDATEADGNKKKPFDPSIFAQKMAEETAKAVAKGIQEGLTKYAEAQRATAAPGPVAKSSRQAADEIRPVTKSGKTSFADIVFGQGLAEPRG